MALAVCVMLPVPAASAAPITASRITSPGGGAELFYDGDAGSGSATVRGTVTGASTGATGDLLCYTSAAAKFTKLASGISVSSGSFAFDASLSPIAGAACRLALVPAGQTPTGAAAAAFAGPAISVSDRFSHSAAGNLYGYYILSGTLPWSFALQSLGDCPVLTSYATDPTTLGSFSLFAGNACLPTRSGVGSAAGTRSALQVDGMNAYPPAAISSLSGQAGFEPLTYSATFDSTHDTVTINETDIPTICDPPAIYPPTSGTCPSLHDSGIEVRQTTTLLPGGQVVRVSQRFTSLDGRRHSIDALFAQSVQAPTAGEAPGFEFPGQTSFATQGSSSAFSAFPLGTSSIIAVADHSSLPGVSNPIGAITYGRPPTSADFVTAAGTQTATFLMHYADSIAANGSVAYDWSFSQASSSGALASLEQVERDRFSTPTVRITRPRDHAVTKKARLLVAGTATDDVGVASLTVDGRGVPLRHGGFSTTVRLRRGKNVITVTARNEAGNAGVASATITYKAPPCRVPKLRGKSVAAAKRALAAADCRVGKIRKVRSPHVRKGRVVSSVPRSRTRHRPGARVGLSVSRGG